MVWMFFSHLCTTEMDFFVAFPNLGLKLICLHPVKVSISLTFIEKKGFCFYLTNITDWNLLFHVKWRVMNYFCRESVFQHVPLTQYEIISVWPTMLLVISILILCYRSNWHIFLQQHCGITEVFISFLVCFGAEQHLVIANPPSPRQDLVTMWKLVSTFHSSPTGTRCSMSKDWKSEQLSAAALFLAALRVQAGWVWRGVQEKSGNSWTSSLKICGLTGLFVRV